MSIRLQKILVVAGAGVICLLAALLANHVWIGHFSHYIYNSQTIPDDSQRIGIVFGGGIENNRPKALLKDRLDTGANLLRSGKVRKLIVSGDNRFAGYDEPRVMRDYLVRDQHIDAKLVQLDSAGRSTYETCQRARVVFGLHEALLISESTHLPRAIYLCRSFGITAFGYASDGPALQTYQQLRTSQTVREVAARLKAAINVYLVGERTVLGPPIRV